MAYILPAGGFEVGRAQLKFVPTLPAAFSFSLETVNLSPKTRCAQFASLVLWYRVYSFVRSEMRKNKEVPQGSSPAVYFVGGEKRGLNSERDAFKNIMKKNTRTETVHSTLKNTLSFSFSFFFASLCSRCASLKVEQLLFGCQWSAIKNEKQ